MTARRRVFTPNQIGASTFLTGPLSGTLLLWLNAKAQDQTIFSNIVLVGGALAFTGTAAYLFLLPEAAPSLPIILTNTLLAYGTAKKSLPRAEINKNRQFDIASFGVASRLSLLMVLASFVLMFLVALIATF